MFEYAYVRALCAYKIRKTRQPIPNDGDRLVYMKLGLRHIGAPVYVVTVIDVVRTNVGVNGFVP